MLTLHSPALITDLAAVFCPGGHVDRRVWALAQYQWRNGITVALRLDGETIAVLGALPSDCGRVDGWFMTLPVAAKHMLSIIRAARLTLRSLPYAESITVATYTRAGERIAAASGFNQIAGADGVGIWAYGRTVGRKRQRSKIGAATSGSVTASAACGACKPASRNGSGCSQPETARPAWAAAVDVSG